MRVGQVSSLITQQVNTMAAAEDLDKLCSKHKALTALLPYVVWEERDGKPEMLDVLLHAARASGPLMFRWSHAQPFAIALFSKATPRATVLTSPWIAWGSLNDGGKLAQLWAAATSLVPHTEGVAESVVGVLLVIAPLRELSPHITTDVWPWLKTRPPLPPIPSVHYYGTSSEVVKVVRRLNDIEILKSYLLIAWSEWDTLQDFGFEEMCASLREDFCGIGMGRHRADLAQRLDHILEQLDRGLGYLEEHGPNLDECSRQGMKCQYRKLREVLLEIDTKMITRMSSYPTTTFSGELIQADIHRISHDLYVCASPPMSITSRPEPSTSLVPLHRLLCTQGLKIPTPVYRTPHHTFPVLIVFVWRALFLWFLQ